MIVNVKNINDSELYDTPTLVGYSLTLSDGTKWAVPLDEANTHYQLIQEWLAEGNTPEEAE